MDQEKKKETLEVGSPRISIGFVIQSILLICFLPVMLYALSIDSSNAKNVFLMFIFLLYANTLFCISPWFKLF